MLRIKDITLERLRNGELNFDLPEIYRLKEVIENNRWHNNESVFDHTLNVLSKLYWINETCSSRVQTYLDQHIDENTQGEILYIAAIYHDIGKKVTMEKRGSNTSFYGHEEEGAKIVKPMLEKFFISDLEQRIVTQIIMNHGGLHNIITPKNMDLEEQYDKFISNNSDTAIELILLAMADTSASHLKYTNPKEFRFRMEFYRNIIDNY
ncbi:MAG: HD domain-containing protein [Candidatus Woesearchaeota archaeon]